MRIFAVVGLVALSACAEQKTDEEKIAEHLASCAAYGFTPGTSEMAQCVASESARLKERNYQRRAAFGDAMRSMGSNMQSQNRTSYASCSTYGNTTNCYGY